MVFGHLLSDNKKRKRTLNLKFFKYLLTFGIVYEDNETIHKS
jgi:hypothetical protein